ncbi:MAG: hypothetical protein SF187_05110 [Deltaproteobacteria bacterium]|nr:hypothetical protein [Deltaproteobacteria bacterium]
MKTALVYVLLPCLWLTSFKAAEACEPSPTGVWNRSASIRDGAEDVPTNVLPVITYSGDGVGLAQPLGGDLALLEGDMQTPVAVTIETLPSLELNQKIFRLRPPKPLEPDTVYRLADKRGPLPCGGAIACGSMGQRSFAVFRTGMASDATAPKFGGIESLRTYITTCGGPECCGPFAGTLVDLKWTMLPVDENVVLYAVYVNNMLITYLTQPATFRVCGEHPFYAKLPTGSVRVVAVDRSGNEDMNNATKVLNGDTCTPLASLADAGIDASPSDTRTSTDAQSDAGMMEEDSAACACHVGRRPGRGAPYFLWLALFAVGTHLRRRSR